MTVVASGREGTIRWAIDANRGPLEFLDSKSKANDLVRSALLTAGRAWIGAFLPKRFSDYVDNAPFPYPKHRDGFYVNKARRMGILQRSVFDRFFLGWDPWSTDRPPFALVKKFKDLNPKKYLWSQLGGGTTTSLFADMRQWAKKMSRDVALRMLDQLIPLIESGALQRTALAGARASSTATTKNQSIAIKIPMPVYAAQLASGKFGHNPTVRRVLVTVPTWEVQFIAKIVQRALAAALSRKHGLQTKFGQTVVGQSAARRSQTASASAPRKGI